MSIIYYECHPFLLRVCMGVTRNIFSDFPSAASFNFSQPRSQGKALGTRLNCRIAVFKPYVYPPPSTFSSLFLHLTPHRPSSLSRPPLCPSFFCSFPLSSPSSFSCPPPGAPSYGLDRYAQPQKKMFFSHK